MRGSHVQVAGTREAQPMPHAQNILGLQDVHISGKEPWGLDCPGRGQDPGPAEADGRSGAVEVREVAGMGTKVPPAQLRCGGGQPCCI